jgi:glycosyltransferase involved in cell wall biosynthesis
MRIMHINTEKTWRGGENQMKLLINGLWEKGIASFLVAPSNSHIAQKARDFKAEKIFLENMRGEFDIFLVFKLAKIVDEYKINILHAHTSHAHTLAFLVKLIAHYKPKIVVTRRVDFYPYRKETLLNLLNRIKYKKGADHYIAISNKIKQILIECGIPENKITVVYSGVDPQRVIGGDGKLFSKIYKKNNEFIVGNISYFADHKAHEDLIKAIKIVKERGYNVRLFLAGYGEREGFLKKLTEEMGLEKDVVFLGFVENVKDLLAFFELFVVSSREEGLCSSIIDAFFAGCPVVATDAGGIPELVINGETGVLVSKGDPFSLANGIIWAMENPSLMKEMAEKAREFAHERFTAGKMVEGNLKVYRMLIGGE